MAFVARCAHLQSAAAARGIDRCCKRRRALPNRAKKTLCGCGSCMAELWPKCVCVCVPRHSLYLSLWPAACCKRACGMWHLWHTYKSNWHLVRGTRHRLRCVSRMCPSDAIKHQIMHAHSTSFSSSSSSCNVPHQVSLSATPSLATVPLSL